MSIKEVCVKLRCRSERKCVLLQRFSGCAYIPRARLTMFHLTFIFCQIQVSSLLGSSLRRIGAK